MVVDIGQMPLIGTVRVLISTAGLEFNSISWLIEFSIDVSESFVHWSVNHHIFAMSDTRMIAEDTTGILRKLGIPNARGTKVKESQRGDASFLKI
jgi:hypothetical protein